MPLDQLALPTGQLAHGRNTAAGPTCPTNRAAGSWTQHCHWTNLPYQPGSLLMDTTLPLDQLALQTGQPAHGHNTAAGPTCPTNRAACSWTQHCHWTNLPYQPGSLLMDATLPLDQLTLQTGQPANGRNSWTNLPYQPGSLLMDATLPLDQLALPTGQPAHGHNSWTNWPYQTGSLIMDTTAGPTGPTKRAACSWTQQLDQLALLAADRVKWARDGHSIHYRKAPKGATLSTIKSTNQAI